MSDIYDPMIDRLDQINGNLIDNETAHKKTNELLGQILEELKTLNKNLQPYPNFPNITVGSSSGYTCWKCGGWVNSPAPHVCKTIIT